MLFVPKPPARFRGCSTVLRPIPHQLAALLWLYRRCADTWTKTNIVAHISHVIAAGWIPETRILKLWRNQKGLDFPSFYLELAVIRALAPGLYKSGLANDVWKVFQFLAGDFPSARIQDPANTNNVISDDLDADDHVDAADGAARGRLADTVRAQVSSLNFVMYIPGWWTNQDKSGHWILAIPRGQARSRTAK